LSVGEPVKNRDTSELKESPALTPQMISIIPMASRATERPLYIEMLLKILSAIKAASNRLRVYNETTSVDFQPA
jgi:hypothetical protein